MEETHKSYEDMEFKISHILDEGDHCKNMLTNFGVDNRLHFKWFNVLHPLIRLDFFS